MIVIPPVTGGGAGDGGDDVSLDWPLPRRLRGPVLALAPIQLASAATDNFPDLPLW